MIMLARPLRSLRDAVTHLIPDAQAGYAPLGNGSVSPSDTPSTDRQTKKANGAVPTLVATIQVLLFFLLPSFLQRRLRPEAFKPRRLFPTSWLDGLRGVASFFVYGNHYTAEFVPWYKQPYGFAHDQHDHAASSPLQLPFVRLIYSGRPMVHVFFVISGFVLSHKPLRLIRAKKYADLHATLASSVFRRGFRLFLPTTASTFIIMVLIRLGYIGHPLPTLYEQLIHWKNALFAITFSWRWDVTQILPYDPHLWTIPIEFSFSMLLFVALLGLSRTKTFVRLVALACLMLYCMRCQHWAGCEFLGGMAIAEIGIIQDERRAAAAQDKEARSSDLEAFGPSTSNSGPAPALALSDPAPSSSSFPMLKRAWSGFLLLNLLFALFVAGWPSRHARETWGIGWLFDHSMDPFHATGETDLISFPWLALGSLQIVFAIQQLPWLQSLFVTPLAQYLADISYALYICHGPVMAVLAHHWMPRIWHFVGGADHVGMWGRLLGWFLGWAGMGVVIIWASDLFWRSVDVKSVELTKWFEAVCMRND